MVKMKQHPSRSSLPPPMQPLPAVGSHAGVNKHIFFYTGWQSNPGKKKLFFFNIDSSKKKKKITPIWLPDQPLCDFLFYVKCTRTANTSQEQ